MERFSLYLKAVLNGDLYESGSKSGLIEELKSSLLYFALFVSIMAKYRIRLVRVVDY